MKTLTTIGITLSLLGMLAFAFVHLDMQDGNVVQLSLFWSNDPEEVLSRPRLALAALSVLGSFLIMLGGLPNGRKVERRPKTSSLSRIRLNLTDLPKYD